MTVKELETLFDYCYWANKQLEVVMSDLTSDLFTHHALGGHVSVRDTMVHIMSAEWGWVEACGGKPRGPALDALDYPSVASLFECWNQVEGHTRTFVSGLCDEDLHQAITFTLDKDLKTCMAMGDVLRHVAIHGIHHRGQVALLLRQLELSPGYFDFIIYLGQSPRIDDPPGHWGGRESESPEAREGSRLVKHS